MPDWAEAIAAWNRRADTRPAPVSVRPLVWEAHPAGVMASDGFGSGYLIDTRGKWRPFAIKWAGSLLPSHDTLDEYKVAAQADYKARILSALQPAPAVEGLSRKLLDEIALECQQTGQVPSPAIAAAYEALEDALLGRAAYEGEKRDG